MTQEERDELQGYLDERIFGTRRQMRSKYRDEKWLEEKQVDVDDLYQIVKDIRDINKINDMEIDDALDKVADCLRKINFHGMQPSPNSKNSSKYVPRDKMPFLVKQVLWLICYKALQAGLKQKDVFEKFEKYDIYVSHNFFSSLEQTPDYFLRCEEYSQPENPCKYKGQKKDELAVAIKTLVYQAGKHSCFVDIFGGSGSASVAVCRKRRVKYVYNEKNKAVCNYIKTLEGDDYKKVIEGLRIIQDDLSSPDNNICSSYMEFNICEVIGRYINFKQKNSKRKLNKNDLEIIDLEREIQGYADADFELDSQRLRKLMEQFPNKIHVFKDEIEGLLKEKKIFRGISSFEDLESMNTIDAFYQYENDFYYFSLNYMFTWGLQFVKGMYGYDRITYDDWRRMLRQYKALGYYAYFYLLRKKGYGGSVDRAVGEIYLWFFSTRASIGSSSIIYDGQSAMFGKANDDIYKFIREDFEHKVKEFHDALSGTVIENRDFRGIIQKYTTENTLFYSDSPYIGTSDYDDNAGKVSKFSGDDMKDLIKGLIQGLKTTMQEDAKKAPKPGKFIFSMRAVKSGEEVDASGKKKHDKIVSGNEEICQYVYKEFAAYKKSLYVLVIYEKEKDLCDLIQKSKVIEIMITNYEIKNFEIKKGKKEKVKVYICKVFEFGDYLNHIKENMVGYKKDWGL